MPCLFVDNLTVIDCSILDPERGLIGASWAVDIELHGELDAQSMVFDFAKVKKNIKQVIDLEIDHKLLIPAGYTGLDISEGDALEIEFIDRQQRKYIHHSPASAVCRIAGARVSRESIVAFLEQILQPALPKNVQKLAIELRQEETPGHYYRYSHGLKKHDGNCQRIAHGHRSQIQIWQNGQRAPQLEQDFAQRWHDIYVGTKEDVVSQENNRVRLQYDTPEGQFILELPEQCVHLMDDDSTVECIANHVRELLLSDWPDSEFRVKAFEGIGKGAIS